MAYVQIWADKYPTGWDGGDLTAPLHRQVLADVAAFAAEYQTDAHFAPYWLEGLDGQVPDDGPRINKDALPLLAGLGMRLRFQLAAFDVDDEVAHAAGGQAVSTAAWRDAFDAAVSAAPWPLSWYHTQRGARLLALLPEPVDRLTFIHWRTSFAAALGEHGLAVDPATVDSWNRCYRMPWVAREGGDGQVALYDMHLDALAAGQAVEHDAGPEPVGEGRYAGIDLANDVRDVEWPDELVEGERHDGLFRVLAAYRNRGLGERTLLALAHAVNAACCVGDGLGRAELRRIAANAAKMGVCPPGFLAYRASTGIGPQPGAIEPAAAGPVVGPWWHRAAPDDIGADDELPWGDGSQMRVAKAVLDVLECEGQPLVHDRGSLWRYAPDRGIWVGVEDAVVRRVVQTFNRKVYWGEVLANGDRKLRRVNVTAQLCKDVVAQIKDYRGNALFFDRAAPGMVFDNGFLRLAVDGDSTTLDLVPWSPGQRATSAVAWAYTPEARPDLWLQTLGECFAGDPDVDEKVELLRQFIGVGLLGLAPRFAKGMILLGSGANGKSVVQEVIESLFPESAVTAIPPQSMDQEYRRAQLATSLLNSVSELPEAEILSSEGVKAIFTGNQVEGRHIRRAPFKFRCKAAQLFSANLLPAVRDSTRGFWRRWLILAFNRAFTEDEQDKTRALRIVAAELAAICAWALAGGLAAVQGGNYAVPDSSNEALRTWQSEADQIHAFLDDVCEVDGRDKKTAELVWTTSAQTYAMYRQWSERTGHGRLSQTMFGKRVRMSGDVQVKRANVGTVYALRISSQTAQLTAYAGGKSKPATD